MSPIRVPRFGRKQLVGVGAVVLVFVVAGLTYLLWPHGSGSHRAAPANYSINTRYCLIDDPADTQSTSATTVVWASLQQAAAGGRVNVEHVSVPPGSRDPESFINGLAQHHCRLIFAVGQSLDAPLQASASANPQQQYVAVNGTASAPNVRAIQGNANQLPDAVRNALQQSGATTAP